MEILSSLLGIGLSILGAAPVAPHHDLTFEERVAAQRAIEQTYYAHQTEVALPFEEAVPLDLLERKVRDYLRQSVVLEQRWGQPITAQMLREEAARMARSTRMPERLTELYEALGNDPVLIQECLVRPALAARLARARFSSDPDPQGSWDDFEEADVKTVALASEPIPSPQEVGNATPLDYVWDTGGGMATPPPEQTVPQTNSRHAVWTGSLMIVGEGTPSARFERYDPALDLWTAASTVNAPGPTAETPPVWTGQYVIVPGRRYDPIADIWSTISTVNAPSAGSVALWTGREVLLWGRNALAGGRYNPATDTWAPITTAGAPPSDPYLYFGVWTGSRMVVWGTAVELVFGQFIHSYAAGSYDPVANTWQPISMVGRPNGTGPKTVWAGGRMVVWGSVVLTCLAPAPPPQGCSNIHFDYPSTGGSYDPVTDSWISFTGPAGRIDPSAVSTGGEAVFWGGAGTAHYQDGFFFNPQNGVITPLSTAGAPSPRKRAAAVYTGKELIVWGGTDPAGAVLNGGRYRPDPGQGPDDDGDGFASPGDCDDTDERVYPRAPQTCDGVNNDCLDPSYPDLARTNEGDDDGDGYSECSLDCDDAAASVHPGAPDLPGNAADEDCDGTVACDPSSSWESMGEFMACVASTCNRLVASGLLTAEECAVIKRRAARIQQQPPQ